MQHRNLNRIFCFNKAARLWTKDTGLMLGFRDIIVLICLEHLDDVRGVGCTYVVDHTKKFGRTLSAPDCISILRRLAGLGLADGVKGRYRLTTLGKNALNSLEERCRLTRWDK